MIWLGLGPYLLNCAVGLAAQLRGARFGVWHHVLYAAVVLTSLATAWLSLHPALLLTLLALAVFPKARPRTILHPALAVLGLVGYGLALLG
ncbi:MAG: hypothetical protein AAF721_36205 [Myxococcota bacterium]